MAFIEIKTENYTYYVDCLYMSIGEAIEISYQGLETIGSMEFKKTGTVAGKPVFYCETLADNLEYIKNEHGEYLVKPLKGKKTSSGENIRELEVGKTFYFQGHRLEVVEEKNSFNCKGCFILNIDDVNGCETLAKKNLIPKCLSRKDGKDVIFVKTGN